MRRPVAHASRTRLCSDRWTSVDYKRRREIKWESSVHDRGDQRGHTGNPRNATSRPILPCAGFEVLRGGEESSFTSFRAGTSYLNLIVQSAERRWFWWGRVIFYVADVDALYDRALAAGYQPATVPHDAEWGERFFHLIDPDGHELSFARPLLPASGQ